MAHGERGLGRGLGALIPTGGRLAGGYREIAVVSIVPNTNQPRTHFDEEPLDALADSIGRIGVLQPVLVRQVEADRFELIAGERRWRAAKRAGLQTIPALVRSAEDQESLEEALVENLHREDLNPLEEAAAFLQLQQDFGLTQQAVANRVGRSRAAVTNSTRLLQLPGEVQELIASRRLSAGHGRALAGIADSAEQVDLARQIVREGWSVRQLEDHLRSSLAAGGIAAGAGPAKRAAESDGQSDGSVVSESALLELENLLAEFLSTVVRVEIGEKKGRLMVEFADLDDLERIYHLVTR
ncbi:MAG: ParB/RepB/Spo0J family partition protein [Acidimicrobiia bacterium]|nr:ParB/RepB/Spo0J family partition protein [Acidimicrobiia bacterium]MYC46285.1 ParB/RepB/Spo0J family partition protein [Acidimicrobiia bacterium]MYI20175.1 ParB/RepB/Spo0J family partition protein [Acidimicrobiia bacterium]